MSRPKAAMQEAGEGASAPSATSKLNIINADYVELRWSHNKFGGKGDYSRLEAPKRTDFSRSHMEGQDLSNKVLQGIIFKNSYLADNDFSGADMRWTDFTGCDAEALKTNNWEGANLFEAITVSGKRIDGTQYHHPWE